MMTGSGKRAVSGLLLVTFLAAPCSLPPDDFESYRQRGLDTAGEVLSAARTAELLLVTERMVFRSYLETGLQEADEDASAAVDAFAGLVPPDKRARALRDELTGVLESTRKAISVARAGIGPDGPSVPGSAVDGLRRAARELERFIRG